MYKILPGIEAEHIDPTPANAEAYARFIITAAPRPMSERLEVARQFGWESSEVKDEIFFGDYQARRASLLFPDHKKAIGTGGALSIPEVDRAEANFTRLTGLALREPSLSLSELGEFLTQLSLTSSKVGLKVTHTAGHLDDGETAP